MNLKKCYKCNIQSCTNLVKSKGAFCKSCFDKAADDTYGVIKCILCNQIVGFTTNSSKKNKIRYRLYGTVCNNCINKLEKEVEE